MLTGRIIKNISNQYTVLVGDKTYECRPRGKFRKENITPLVGDYCHIDEKENYLLEILPRKNKLQRPSVTNVDYALVVTSLKHPDFNALLLDKQLTSILLENIRPVLCFTKEDLITNKEQYQAIKSYYKKIGIPVFTNTQLEELTTFLKGSVVVLTGQSGAGKTTLLNKIDPNLNLKTDDISYALNRGKHTTRHTEIHQIKGIFFCDTPGFSALDLSKYPKEDIQKAFIEFSNYECFYSDCAHQNEPKCGVKEALQKGKILQSRYENYLKIWKGE